MKKSTHRVEVIRLDPFKHPNADSLSLQKVFGYTVILRTEDWVGIEYGAYIVPDSVVDTQRPEFSWLAPPTAEKDGNKNFREAFENDQRFHRVTVMRMRGILSYGLMVPAPPGSREGDDVSDILGVQRYNPVIASPDGIEGPERYAPDYDIEAFERYATDIFKPGEEIICVEKLDGEQVRYCFHEDRVHSGSKHQWIDPIKGYDSTAWKMIRQDPAIEDFVVNYPELTIFGEAVGYSGRKSGKRYNVPEGRMEFYAFDILHKDQFLDYDEMVILCRENGIKVAPEVGRVRFDPDKIRKSIPKKTLTGANHAPEGIVCRPLKDRIDLQGRAVLKLVLWE